jgi:hypothetical protein
MRRILVLLTVALFLVAMMLTIAMPAFADSPWSGLQANCTTKQGKPEIQFTRENTNKVKTICLVNPDAF